ncbi:MAG: hypothetical protein QMB92_01740 [Thiopseudomonas sp.]
MATCLFCHQETADSQQSCEHCGMALPRQQQAHKTRTLRRFVWFVIGLTLFCGGMILWLGRTPPAIG